MKHGLLVKFFAFFLTACSLVLAAVGAAGILILESNDLYTDSLEEQQKGWFDGAGQIVAQKYAARYAARELGGCSTALLNELYNDTYYGMDAEYWSCTVYQDGKVVSRSGNTISDGICREYTFSVEYPVAVPSEVPDNNTEPAGEESTQPTSDASDPTWGEEATAPSMVDPAQESGKSAASDGDLPEEPPLYIRNLPVWEQNKIVNYTLYYYDSPIYMVRVEMSPEVTSNHPQAVLTNIYPYRYTLIVVLLTGLLLFAGGAVFLCWAAGKTADGGIRPGGLNRIPLDLYAGGAAGGVLLLLLLMRDMVEWGGQSGFGPAVLTGMALGGIAIALVVLGFLFALSAQVKVPGKFWWHHSVVGFCLGKIGKFLKLCFRGLRAVFRMMNVTGQWILVAAGMGFCLLVSMLILVESSGEMAFPVFAAVVLCVAIVLYGGYCFGTLLSGIQKMTQEDLNHKIPTQYLVGKFRDFALALNSLSETAVYAAREQVKSDRMKTELITNVSHDIKTPLTSIINFVDLLQKPHTEQEGKQYLEVLSRQSLRMKRLIEDLMDLSKASTGNMPVNPVRLDAVETVNQALGEFADKFSAVNLVPVFRQPKEPVYILADGRLTWRVLSNLLNNAEKYAMPGTRLYMELVRAGGNVCLSLKNVSRDALNTNAEELMERFVRGDVSRNTEGSGLGLNIAKSLMEVQHGQLQLLVDGDLFKVTLIFPGA